MQTKARIEAALARAVESGAAPGIVAAAVTPADGAIDVAVGARGVEDSTPMDAATVFWIASCTKAITAAAALQLVERGQLSLDEPVAGRLPTLASPKVLTGFDADGAPKTRPAKGPITARHLLTHTSGLAYDFCNADLTKYFAATGTSLFGAETPDIPLIFDPGERWQYGIGLDWTGKLIEAVSGQRLDHYMDEHIFAPLGMADTSFFPVEAHAARKAGMHGRRPDGGLDPASFGMPPAPHFGMGGGGLYSTAPDYLRFLGAILADGAPILGAEGMALMRGDQVGEMSAGFLKSAQPMMSNDFDPFPGCRTGWSCGFGINTAPGPAGRATGSLMWGGLANCYYWADPTRGVAGVFLSQVLPFADPRILAAFADFERAVYGG
ncbi:MAG TPA: serine hydrolase domain-containing protein [Caulobacteraceae bacterium]|nr:serine hydrolase domain-containing protein [Caulobacteraceae bacterium]